ESLPSDWTEEQTAKAIERYKKFLVLIAQDPRRAVAPTRDIDVIWHLHMLSPRAYYKDCQRLFGMILDHDGGFGALPEDLPILQSTFEDTARAWEDLFGEPYIETRPDESMTKCTHNCQSRCWHACKSVQVATQ